MKAWLERVDEWTNHHRPSALLAVVVLTASSVWLANWVTGSDLFRQLFFPVRATPADVRFWSALVYALAFAMGLPAAFLLWHWRDRNVRDQIENSRKDINLKEFQEVQSRAAGAFNDDIPLAAKRTLQIASLHQLRPFLKGDYGVSFRRPTFELLLALHQSMGERLEAPRFRMEASTPPADGDWRRKGEEIRKNGTRLRDQQSSLERSAGEVISSEWRAIWRSGFPLTSRTLDLIAIPHHAELSHLELTDAQFAGAYLRNVHFDGANLSFAHLEGADLRGAHLEGANLSKAHLEGARLIEAHLKGADLEWAHLEGADLRLAHIEGASLRRAHLEGADLRRAHLVGADLRRAHLVGADLYEANLDGADLTGASFDNKTILLADWDTCSPKDRAAAQQKLRVLGARHVDDP